MGQLTYAAPLNEIVKTKNYDFRTALRKLLETTSFIEDRKLAIQKVAASDDIWVCAVIENNHLTLSFNSTAPIEFSPLTLQKLGQFYLSKLSGLITTDFK